MISSATRQKAFTCLRLYSLLAPFPLKVDVPKQDILLEVTKWRKVACWVSLLTYMAHAGFKLFRLGQAVILGEETPWPHLVMHIVMALAGVMDSFFYYLHFFRHPEVFAAVERMTLRGTYGSPGKSYWLQKMKTRKGTPTLQDIIAKYLPEMVAMGVAVLGVGFLVDSSMEHLLHSAIPQAWKSSYVCNIVAFILELRYISFFGFVSATVFHLHLITFDVILDNLQEVARQAYRLKYRLTDATAQLRSLRCLQLYVELFNIVSRHAIFAWKLTSLTACIVNGYAAIAHFKEHVVFGIMYYTIFVDSGVFYALIYERAFQVPGRFDDALRSMSLRIRQRSLPVGAERTALEKQIKSIPRVGVKVGGFHKMERASTPNYLDFVFQNIVNMLVAHN